MSVPLKNTTVIYRTQQRSEHLLTSWNTVLGCCNYLQIIYLQCNSKLKSRFKEDFQKF